MDRFYNKYKHIEIEDSLMNRDIELVMYEMYYTYIACTFLDENSESLSGTIPLHKMYTHSQHGINGWSVRYVTADYDNTKWLGIYQLNSNFNHKSGIYEISIVPDEEDTEE